MKGTIFDIQHYAIFDGPGIRTLVFLKGCPLNCLWCHNPESQDPKKQISYFHEKCISCETCVKSCDKNALELLESRIQWKEELCNMCGECINVCPNKALEIIGEDINVKDVLKIILRDKPFYDNSGGGVTISGGEPTFQLPFLVELLNEFKKAGIHTAIETCGYFNEDIINKLINLVDLFLFDIKHINPEEHLEYTGVSNEKILRNFEKILKRVGSEGIICRIPLIPAVNTDIKLINQILIYLKSINYKGSIHLMPYNKLSKTKYEKIGKSEEYRDLGDLSEDKINAIINIIEKNSFEVICNE